MPLPPRLLSAKIATSNLLTEATRISPRLSYVQLPAPRRSSCFQAKAARDVSSPGTNPRPHVGWRFFPLPRIQFPHPHPSHLRRHLARRSPVFRTQNRLAYTTHPSTKSRTHGARLSVALQNITDERCWLPNPVAESAEAQRSPTPQASPEPASMVSTPTQSPAPHPSAQPNSISFRS
jgi:hypothetical protein